MKKRNLNLGRRALAMFVSLTMCLGMLQITAFAVEGEEENSDTTPAITDTGVNVDVTEKEPSTDEETGVSTEGWTASGEDEKGIKVEIDSTTTTAPVEGEGDAPDATKTETAIETTLTNKGELDLDDAKVEQGEEPELEAVGKEDIGSEDTNLDVNLEVSATVKPGNSADVASGTSGDITDKILGILQNDSGLNDCQKDENVKFEDKTDNDDGSTTYVAKTTDEDGNPQTITITIRKDGSYTKTIRTEKTEKGEFEEANRGEETVVEGNLTNVGTSNDTENPLPVVPTEVKPEVPAVGDTVERGEYTETVSKVEQNEETGVYTITYEYQLPVLDSDGNPVVDEDGNPVTTTETRTETLSGTSNTTTTEQVVTEKREDTVTITEVTVDKKVQLGDATGGGTSLDLSLSMEPVDYQFGKGGHGTLYQDEETEESGSWIPDNGTGGDSSQRTELQYLEQKFGLITINDVSSTKVTVRQEKANDTSFKADIEVDLTLAKDKLTGNRLMLVVKQGDVEKTAFLNPDEKDKNDSGIILQYDADGKLTGVKFENVNAETFSLQLTGRQKLDENINQGDTKWAQINMTSTINVKVSGVTAQISGTTETKTGDRIDTVTAERTETKTVISSSTTSVLEDFRAPVIPDPEEPDPIIPDPIVPDPIVPDPIVPDPIVPDPIVPDPIVPDPIIPTPPVVDDGDDDDDDITITDPDVPLAGDPGEIDIADESVPLAELPEEVDILDDEVPLAELPEEVEIADEDVPLADVPKTGDISAMWYVVTLLSACGLIGLNTLKKREEA